MQSIDLLTTEQRSQMEDVVSCAFSEMGDKLGCTNLVELEIRTKSSPIKQRYYPISAALQKEVTVELETMLRGRHRGTF